MATKKKTATKKKVPKKKVKAIKKDPIAEYKKQAGSDGSVEMLTLADDNVLSHVKGFISTQSIVLDKLIGAPGIPRGRITEIVGDEHTGKSTVLDHIFAQAQSEGDIAILVDLETARSKAYTTKIGVDPEKLLIAQLDPRRHTLESVFTFVGKTLDYWMQYPEKRIVIGVDSIAGVATERAQEKDAGQRQPGEAASILRHAFRVVGPKLAGSVAALVLINHHYDQIGQTFGDPRISYGGRGIRYHASVRLQLSLSSPIKRSTGQVVGRLTRVHVLKNKVEGKTGAKGKIAILHGVGVDNVYTIFEDFKEAGYIGQGGSWATMILPGQADPLKWQGASFGLLDKCKEHPDLFPLLVSVWKELP